MNDLIGPEALAVTRQVIEALEMLDVPYVVGGSLASIVHGYVRTTMDADIVADLQPEQAPALITALEPQFYVPPESALRKAIVQHRSFNLIHLETMFKVDIFPVGERVFDRQQITRRTAGLVAEETGDSIWILSPEDVVLVKLDWFRKGDEVSERQWRDALGVIRAQQGKLDLPYLREWANVLGVGDLLKQALTEASMAG